MTNPQSPVPVRVILDPATGLPTADPYVAIINRVNQRLEWTLDIADATWNFELGGIVPLKTSGDKHKAWPDGPAVYNPGQNTYGANAGHPLPHGAPVEKYLYDINLIIHGVAISRKAGMDTSKNNEHGPITVDPDIDNQPQP
ncbi:MAG: hypothetical protein QOI24_1890 [Acidobacteriota bacterium]|jgi:hypothetical protein|nr:hypothetical protein [Acidobacteriota bacterium]